MNKRLRNYLYFGLATFCSSCTVLPAYLTPAMAGSDISYLPKPMGSDSIKVRNYVNASIAGNEMPYNSGSFTMGMLNFSRAHTTKNFNFAYGAFGYAGKTESTENQKTAQVAPEFPGKSFYGGGLRSSIGFYDESGSAEFRILSWENALSFENGGYANLRNELAANPTDGLIVSPKTTLFTTGIASEIIWHGRRHPANQFAFRLFFGGTTGLNDSFKNFTADKYNKGGAFDFAFYVKLKNLYGIINSGSSKGSSSKLSLGYAF